MGALSWTPLLPCWLPLLQLGVQRGMSLRSPPGRPAKQAHVDDATQLQGFCGLSFVHDAKPNGHQHQLTKTHKDPPNLATAAVASVVQRPAPPPPPRLLPLRGVETGLPCHPKLPPAACVGAPRFPTSPRSPYLAVHMLVGSNLVVAAKSRTASSASPSSGGDHGVRPVAWYDPANARPTAAAAFR